MPFLAAGKVVPVQVEGVSLAAHGWALLLSWLGLRGPQVAVYSVARSSVPTGEPADSPGSGRGHFWGTTSGEA